MQEHSIAEQIKVTIMEMNSQKRCGTKLLSEINQRKFRKERRLRSPFLERFFR